MKANELRIGNWVNATKGNNYEGKGVIQVTSIRHGGINQWQDMGASAEERYEDVAGLPLTDEWLLKFGFEKDEQHNCFVLLTTESNVDFEYFDGKVHIVGHNSAEPIDHLLYVHQFQNFMYALTGEELTIKEPAM